MTPLASARQRISINGVPNQITENINAFKQVSRVRFDHAWSYFPEQTVGAQRFLPTSVTYPLTDGHPVQRPFAAWRAGVGCVRDRENVDQDQRRAAAPATARSLYQSI
jgi:hypothetical protein